MAYTLDFALALGSGQTGIADLRAQLVDTAGSNTGSAVSTGFTEIGSGNYLWHYASIPDAHRGGVKFYSNATPATILAFAAINPEEAESVAALPTLTDIEASTVLAMAGDQMDLIDAPNATAVTAIQAGLATTGADGDTLETLSDQLDAILLVAGTGAGSSSLVYTVTDADTGLPVADAKVWATTDIPGNNIVAGGRTSTLGVVTFYLDPGTYYIWRRHAKYNFDPQPDTETVT